MTSYSSKIFSWGTITPPGMAGISTNGPRNVPFACTPTISAQQYTFTWYQLGNGCPNGYSWSPSSTCISTAGVYNTMSWNCIWTTPLTSTSFIKGGTTTAAPGLPATATAPVQWVTVTNTVQTTSTTTSTYAPGAKTVTVTSTQGVQKRNDDYIGALFPALNDRPDLQRIVEDGNITYNPIDSRAVCSAGNINCGLNCCSNSQTCIAGGTFPCCSGWACVPYNSNSPFTGLLDWAWKGYTSTTTSWILSTTFAVVNPAGSTITIKPTSTTSIDITETKLVTTTITANVPTVTVVNIITLSTSVILTGGGGTLIKSADLPTTEVITSIQVITSGASTIILDASTFTRGSSVITADRSTLLLGGTPYTITTVLVQQPISTATGLSPANSNSNTTNTNSNPPLNTTLIVGVAAGIGTPLFLCLIGLLIFLIRRHRRRNPPQPPRPLPDLIGSYGGGGEAVEAVARSGTYVQTAHVASKPAGQPVMVDYVRSGSPVSPVAGYGEGGYGPGPGRGAEMGEMYAPTNRASELYSQPPRYASSGYYHNGNGNQVLDMSEAQMVAHRYELSGRTT